MAFNVMPPKRKHNIKGQLCKKIYFITNYLWQKKLKIESSFIFALELFMLGKKWTVFRMTGVLSTFSQRPQKLFPFVRYYRERRFDGKLNPWTKSRYRYTVALPQLMRAPRSDFQIAAEREFVSHRRRLPDGYQMGFCVDDIANFTPEIRRWAFSSLED